MSNEQGNRDLIDEMTRAADRKAGGRIAAIERGPTTLVHELHVAFLWQSSMRELLGLPDDANSCRIELEVRKLVSRVKELEAAQKPRPMSKIPPDGFILGWDSTSTNWVTVLWDGDRQGWWAADGSSSCRISAWLPCPPGPEVKP